ncbi:MAG: fatty acid desaturase CarF family protein [Rickettsiales bacterium]|nr:fatty acid desaturase CarF family protein [Rickettsiales bacterium]
MQSLIEKQDFGRFLILGIAFLILFFANIFLILNTNFEYNFWILLPLFFVSIYLADFTSGILHFIVDFTPCKKGVGLDKLFYFEGKRDSDEYRKMRMEIMKKAGVFQHFVYFFKHHHLVSPANIARRSAFTTFLPTIPISSGYFLINFILLILNINAPHLIFTFFATGVIVLFAQYIHSCTHGRKYIPSAIRFLQNIGLVLSVRKHILHHKDPTKYFCFVNGWADPLVNFITAKLVSVGIYSESGLSAPEKEF